MAIVEWNFFSFPGRQLPGSVYDMMTAFCDFFLELLYIQFQLFRWNHIFPTHPKTGFLQKLMRSHYWSFQTCLYHKTFLYGTYKGLYSSVINVNSQSNVDAKLDLQRYINKFFRGSSELLHYKVKYSEDCLKRSDGASVRSCEILKRSCLTSPDVKIRHQKNLWYLQVLEGFRSYPLWFYVQLATFEHIYFFFFSTSSDSGKDMIPCPVRLKYKGMWILMSRFLLWFVPSCIWRSSWYGFHLSRGEREELVEFIIFEAEHIFEVVFK